MIKRLNIKDRLKKSEIITKFEHKLNNPNLDNQDWSQLKILWETVFSQFSV